MTIYYQDDHVALYHGDCLDVLASMPDNSVDSIVTDPPYGLSNTTPEQVAETITRWVSGDREYLPAGRGFMGKEWDGFVPPVAVWDECLRVLKPGGHVLSFAGTRTMDLMTLGLRLAGFEIRDSIGYASGMVAWVYGSGFPKSHNPGRDKRFCQCEVPDMRDATAEDAAELDAEVLQPEVCRGRQEDASHGEDVRGVRCGVQTQGQVSSGQSDGVLQGVHEQAPIRDHDRSPIAARSACDCRVRPLRDSGGEVSEQGGESGEDLLRVFVPLEGTCGRTDPLRREHEGAEASESPLWGGQPGVEGRSDAQPGQGELYRPPLREMPGGMAHDGPEGRVHHGAPSSDGSVGRQAATANGSGEPHQPRPEGQPQGEPGAVPLERGSQAGRSRPVCAGCGKPLRPEGLGSALKPAWEPCIMARKPLDGTLAANVLEHGTGAINVDACRVSPSKSDDYGRSAARADGTRSTSRDLFTSLGSKASEAQAAGRWPANVLLDEHAAAWVDEQSGHLHGSGNKSDTGTGADKGYGASSYQVAYQGRANRDYGSEGGGASRFFYTAKAPKSERPNVDGIQHPTVKPLAIMRWLIRLVTPPGGTILDPFAGSGTTIEAAMTEGFHPVGIEKETDYLPLITARITRAKTSTQGALDLGGIA